MARWGRSVSRDRQIRAGATPGSSAVPSYPFSIPLSAFPDSATHQRISVSFSRSLSDLSRDVVRYGPKIQQNGAGAMEFAYRINRRSENLLSVAFAFLISEFESASGP